MKIFILILVLSLTDIAWGFKCMKYTCDNNVLENGTCAILNYNIIQLNMCENPKTCILPSSKEVTGICAKKNDIKNRLAGEYCNEANQCRGGVCKENVCVGVNVNETCTVDEDCDVELYCKSNHCTQPNENCFFNEKCKSNQFCVNGKCKNYGKLGIGKTAEVPALCSTYYIKDGKCEMGPSRIDKQTYDCKNNSQNHYVCKYDNNETRFCICGMNQYGKLYCPPGRGELKYDEVLFFQ